MLSEGRLEAFRRMEEEEEESGESKPFALVHPYAQGAVLGHEKEWAKEHGQDGSHYDPAEEALLYWERVRGKPLPGRFERLDPVKDADLVEDGIPVFPKHTPILIHGHWYVGGKRED